MASAIVTIPPYATFLDTVARHPSVSGLRLNTVMPIKAEDSIEDTLKRLNDIASTHGKSLWIDLKCRQLRVKTYGLPPFTEIELSHPIQLDTHDPSNPAFAYFSDGRERVKVLEVSGGNRLIMENGPKRMVGPGESVNIIHPSLSIDGYLTDTDKQYIAAAEKVGIKRYMLSFVENQQDIEQLRVLVPDSRIVAKIESEQGLNFARDEYNAKSGVRLMAARGDLYIQVGMPHQIIDALETIISQDPRAVAASRIFGSFAESYEPSCSDIGDVDNLLRMGYRNFMFGDDICQKRDSIMSGLNLFERMAERYK